MLNINLIKPYLVYYHGNAAFEMEYGATCMGVGILVGGGGGVVGVEQRRENRKEIPSLRKLN